MAEKLDTEDFILACHLEEIAATAIAAARMLHTGSEKKRKAVVKAFLYPRNLTSAFNAALAQTHKQTRRGLVYSRDKGRMVKSRKKRRGR